MNNIKRKYRTPNPKILFPLTPTNIHPKRRWSHTLSQNEKAYNAQLIHNLSTYTQTKDELDILHKGLNFVIPLTSSTKQSTQQDIEKFTTNMHKKMFFYENPPNAKKEKHPVKTSSHWDPPKSENPTICNYIHTIRKTVNESNEIKNHTTRHPINPVALQSLKENTNIIIKKLIKEEEYAF